MRIGYNYLFWRAEYLDLGAGLATGLGYNGGKGVFPSGEVSDTKFYLYTVPLDASFAFETHADSWFKVALLTGPSILGLLQYRTDLGSGDDRKFLRQMGVGYFAEVHFGLGLSKIFPSWGRGLLDEYDVTKAYLVLTARTQKYTGFKESSVTVDGVSFGGGMTFEFF